MEITIFAKKRQTNTGKVFYNYLSTITKKNGEQTRCVVKFKDDAGQPKPENCPCNIVIEKRDCNMNHAEYTYTETDEFTGEAVEKTGLRSTLWVSAWKPGTPYVDHSMDEYF